MCSLIQETTLQNKMNYYSNTNITENQTNYATLCVLATYSSPSQNTKDPQKNDLYPTCFSKMYTCCALVGNKITPIADYK